MKEPEHIARIVEAMVEVLPVPITVKLRSGWDDESLTYLEAGKRAWKRERPQWRCTLERARHFTKVMLIGLLWGSWQRLWTSCLRFRGRGGYRELPTPVSAQRSRRGDVGSRRDPKSIFVS